MEGAAACQEPSRRPGLPIEEYGYRIVAGEEEFGQFKPVLVKPFIRPEGRDQTVLIGRFMRGPRKLTEQTVLLRSAAGQKKP